MSTQTATVMAPADRPPGHRGVRGRVATLLVVAATLTFALLRFHGSSQGSGGNASWTVNYTESTGGWSTPGLLLAAAVLGAGGALLWVARARRFVALAAAAGAAGVGVLAFTIATPPHHATVSAATYRSIRLGASQSLVMSRLGSPLLTNAVATPARGGPSLGCLMYAIKSSTYPSDYFFCFDHGRLAAKVAI